MVVHRANVRRPGPTGGRFISGGRFAALRGSCIPQVYCTNCRRAVPYTGAFAFVVCPWCNAQVHIRRAAPVPEEGASAYPSAAATERVAAGDLRSPAGFALPTAEEINLVGHHYPSDDPISVRAARFMTTVAAMAVLFILANNLVLLVAGAPRALDYAFGTSDTVSWIYLITPLPVGVVAMSGGVAAAWHVAIVAAILASAALFLRQHLPGALEGFVQSLMGPGSPRLDAPNGLYLMARLFTVSLFATEITYLMAAVVGAEPNIPTAVSDAEPGGLLITLANASVWEEVAARVLLLGVPLLAVHWAGRTKLDRPAWSYLTGGKIPLDGAAVAFLLFSSAAFGVAHVPGWDLWKLPGSLVGGLVFGVLFLRLGLHAAIICHFLHDYLPIADFMGVTEGYLVLLGLLVIGLEIVGAVNFIRYLFVVREVVTHGGVPPHLGGPERPAAGGPRTVEFMLGPRTPPGG